METLYTYNRHGYVVSFNWDGENETQERKYWLEVMKQVRGVYKDEESARTTGEQSKPQWVSTGTNGMGYWS